MSSENTGRRSITTCVTSPGESWFRGFPGTLGSTPSPTSITWLAGPPPVVSVIRQEAAPDTPMTACATPCNNAVGPIVVAVGGFGNLPSTSLRGAGRRGRCRGFFQAEGVLGGNPGPPPHRAGGVA